jgi:hypothetical protein
VRHLASRGWRPPDDRSGTCSIPRASLLRVCVLLYAGSSPSRLFASPVLVHVARVRRNPRLDDDGLESRGHAAKDRITTAFREKREKVRGAAFLRSSRANGHPFGWPSPFLSFFSFNDLRKMARDGVEPPTRGFSGELNEFWYHRTMGWRLYFCAFIPILSVYT